MRSAVFWMLFVPFFHSFRLYVARYASTTGNASMPEISGVCLGIIAAIAFANPIIFSFGIDPFGTLYCNEFSKALTGYVDSVIWHKNASLNFSVFDVVLCENALSACACSIVTSTANSK